MSLYPTQLSRSDGVDLNVDSEHVLVSFKDSMEISDAEGILSDFQLELDKGDDNEPGFPNTNNQINHTEDKFWAHETFDSDIEDDTLTDLVEEHENMIEWVGRAYSTPSGLRVAPLPNILLIEFGKDISENVIKGIENKYGLHEVKEKSKLLSPLRYYFVEDPIQHNSPTVYKKLKAEQEEHISDFSFESMPQTSPFQSSNVLPSDPYLQHQNNLNDIEILPRWRFNKGDEIIIAVLDNGCDLNHEDLSYVDKGINAEKYPQGDASPNPDDLQRGGHGTAVAGIAAAITDNAIGIAGAAGGSSIFPVRLHNSSDIEVVLGIRKSIENDSRVINMSFGVEDEFDRKPIDKALEEAFKNDVVLCASVGNVGGTVSYPALSPVVIGVGATNGNKERKTFNDGFEYKSSPDGKWESAKGPGLDVMAPGTHCWTTDIEGEWVGYNQDYSSCSDINYHRHFEGTSAASPHVAGLAALLLTSEPSLTSSEVKDLIESNCRKSGVSKYSTVSGRSNGSWCNEMGYGLICAFDAIEELDKIKNLRQSTI